MPGPIRHGSGIRVGVRSIGLPSPLNQTGVPKPGGLYAANTFPNDLWAGPLASMLQTTMVENLAQRLPADTILADGGAIGASPDQIVEIQIFSFAPDASGTVKLAAQFGTRPTGKQDWNLSNFTASAAGGQTADTITAAMSQLWSQAANHLATMLA
ncbi:MAG: membrane integrity-associated transporter subunit PqiC [Acidocella sp.]